MSDAARDYVFPQDVPNGEPGKARAGGLTKREYAAIQIAAGLAFRGGIGPGADSQGRSHARFAVDCADALLELLNG